MNICFYGAGSRNINNNFKEKGYELGCQIAKRGHNLVFGGGNTGMMGAVVKGVNENNGKSIGIAPKWIEKFEKLSDECSEFIYVDSMDERKRKFLEKSDAFIIGPGGIGTLDEFFEVLTLKKLKKHRKAIVVLNIDNYYGTMMEMIHEMAEKGFLYEQESLFRLTNNVDETLNYLEKY